MKLRATGNNVIVVMDPIDPNPTGAIMIPDGVKFRSGTGTVLSCGPRCRYVSQGQYVETPMLDGQEFEHDGKLLKRIAETDLLAVLNVKE